LAGKDQLQLQDAGQVQCAQRRSAQLAEQDDPSPQLIVQVLPQLPSPPLPGSS